MGCTGTRVQQPGGPSDFVGRMAEVRGRQQRSNNMITLDRHPSPARSGQRRHRLQVIPVILDAVVSRSPELGALGTYGPASTVTELAETQHVPGSNWATRRRTNAARSVCFRCRTIKTRSARHVWSARVPARWTPFRHREGCHQPDRTAAGRSPSSSVRIRNGCPG